MTNTEIKELSFEEVQKINDQELLKEIEKKGTNHQRMAICFNKNVSDDLLKTIAARKNPQLLDLIVINKRLTAKDLFQYVDVSASVAIEIKNYEDCTQEMLDYIDENHLIR